MPGTGMSPYTGGGCPQVTCRRVSGTRRGQPRAPGHGTGRRVVNTRRLRFHRGMPSLILGPALRHVGRDAATVWVETDEPCRVSVLGQEEPTFEVAGHHYALVQVRGLEQGTVTEYQVHLDGDRAWPPVDSDQPPSVIRTLDPDRPQRITFGSCRFSTQRAVNSPRRYGVDALDAYARRML